MGYESNQSEGVVLILIKKKQESKSLATGEEGIIITNQTPFYGESGGQVGDQGTIVSGNSVFEIFCASLLFLIIDNTTPSDWLNS